jgi:uncharacterized protein YdiU (UPF0061 family)
VLVRLSHSHIRIGSFQRLAAFEEHDHLRALVDYCLAQFPGPLPPEDAPGREEPAAILLHQAVERLADLAASYMVAGFVHGVLNTDNMNITGESFDYGPWRFLPSWDPGFTAAYFDYNGLYAFGRQPEALHWNLTQLAIALRPICAAPPLVAAIDRFAPLYQAAMARRFTWRLGVASQGVKRDMALIGAAEKIMHARKWAPDSFFHLMRGGLQFQQGEDDSELEEAFAGYAATDDNDHDYWDQASGEGMLIDEVEAIWSAIAERDDWQPLHAKVAAIRRLGDALGNPPVPSGHVLVRLSH